MDRRAEGLKRWGSTGVPAPNLAGQYILPPGDNGDRDRRELLAEAITALYSAVGSTQQAETHPDETANAVHQLVISNGALAASEADAFLTLVSTGLEAPAQVHLRAIGEMTRRVVLCFEHRDLALELYKSAEPSWRKLGAKLFSPEDAPEFEKGEKDMRDLENLEAFRKGKADVIDRFHLMNDAEWTMFSKRSHGDIYALVDVAQHLQRRGADVRKAVNQTEPVEIGVNVMIDRAIGYVITCFTFIVAACGIQTNGRLEQLVDAYQAMQKRDEESGALRVKRPAL